MTKLSIILYLADIVKNMSVVFLIMGILSTIVAIISGICSLDPDGEMDADAIAVSKKVLAKALIFCMIGWCGYAVLPEKKTIYMIAAVECASAFTETETAKILTTTGKTLLNDVSDVIHSYAVDAIESKKKKKNDDDE